MTTWTARDLRLYGGVSQRLALEWADVERRLDEAPTYWLVAAGPRPHPRPVWGVWISDMLYVSVGSPVLKASIGDGVEVSIHLDSGTDVVIVEGWAEAATAGDVSAAVERYRAKYETDYDAEELGPLTGVRPRHVIAWATAGWAGRGGFQRTVRFDPSG